MKIQYDNQQMRDMGSTLLSQVGGAVSGAVGGLEGMLFQGEQDANQDKQATALGQIQVNDAEQLGAYNLQNQEALWNYTSQPNQVKNMEAAGLNPALMYGAGGAGGQTAQANPGGSAGMAGSAPNEQGMVLGMMTAQMQAQEIQAQTDLLKAQQAKIQAETPSGGPGTLGNATLQNIETSTQSLSQGIQNQQATEAMTKVQTQLAQFQANIANVTQDKQIQMITDMASTINAEMQSKEVQSTIDLKTQGDKIATIVYNMLNSYLTTGKTQADTTLANTNAQLAGQYAQAAIMNANATTKNANTQQQLKDLQLKIQTMDTGTQTAINAIMKGLGIAAMVGVAL